MRIRNGLAAALVLATVSCGGMSAPKVTPAATDDQSLAARVRTALLNDPAVHANEINVTAQNGVVVLAGHVHGQQEVDAAIAAAHRISGVKDVRSELQPDR